MAAPIRTRGSKALLTQTVERLVAASERPNLKYKVDHPQLAGDQRLRAAERPALRDARAARARQRHLRARLGAGARDGACDRAPRRDPRGPGAPGRAGRAASPPTCSTIRRWARWRSRSSKIALASFSRAQELEADGVGVGISARAGFDPYGAVRFLTAMGRNAELRQAANNGVDPRFLDFLSSHPATPDRLKIARANARQFTAPGDVRARQGRLSRRASTACPTARIRAKASCAAAASCIRGSASPSRRRTASRWRTPRRRCSACATAAISALRLDVVRVPAEQTLGAVSRLRLDRERRRRSRSRSSTINGLPTATALAKGDQWTFRLYAIRFGGEVYRFIFAAKQLTAEADRAFRYSVTTFRRMSDERDRARRARCACTS